MSENPNVGGRPLLFKTPDELIEKINEYFDTTVREQYTVTGLALALGTSRETLDNYQERKDFKHIIKEAKLIVENSYELSLRDKGGVHNIFALKNFGWKDKQELEHTGAVPVKDILSKDNANKPESNKEEDRESSTD